MTTRQTTTPAARAGQGERERGSASVYFLLTATAVIIATGLLVDGGETLAAPAQVIDQAEQAARAGVQQMQLEKLRDGHAAPEPDHAITIAENYLHEAGDTGTAKIAGQTLTVTASRTIASRILGAFGIGRFTATGKGVATLVTGVAKPGDLTPRQDARP